jgi:hypothetical protein
MLNQENGHTFGEPLVLEVGDPPIFQEQYPGQIIKSWEIKPLSEGRMSALSFVYWLQGFFEISESETLTPEQVKVIKDHIALVLNKETPNRSAGIVDWGPQVSC